MSRRGNNKKAVDLKLDLALPARGRGGGGGSEDESSQDSCVSSEGESVETAAGTSSSMVLAACPRCLMYVMLAEDEAKCPKCKSAVLLDFLGGCSTGKNKTGKT